jgi:hypothetical protein
MTPNYDYVMNSDTRISNEEHKEELVYKAGQMYRKVDDTELGDTEKYPNWESIFEIMFFYYSVFDVLESRGCKNVLDFGCGFGMGKIVHDLGRWNFDLTMADSTLSWHKREKAAFDFVTESYGFSVLRFTNILKPDFKFVDPIEKKFDAVLTIRFPPISKMKIAPATFKERLSEYCEEEFDYVYLYKNPEHFESLGVVNEAKKLIADTSHKEEIINDEYLMRIY